MRGVRRFSFLDLLKVLGVALPAGALASGAGAQDIVVKRIDEAPDWAPAQYQDAQPLDLPLATVTAQELLEREAEGSPSSDAQVSAEGRDVPEAKAIAADPDARLFPELPEEDRELGGPDGTGIEPRGIDEPEPLDAGVAEAYFSSSRLIPTGARRYYPYRTVGKLFFSIPGAGRFICSGAVLRPRLILTAGHCVHSGGDGVDGFFEDFVFVPAYHEGNAPYKAWEAAVVWTTGSWASSGGIVPNRADFAIIEVRNEVFRKDGRNLRKRIGDVTGYLGYRTNGLLPNHTKQLGYPANHDFGEIMHQVDSQYFVGFDQDTVLYGNDMAGGSSGGPWVENFGWKAEGQTDGLAPFPNSVVGVTSFGFIPPPDFKLSGSSTLNGEFLALVQAACGRRADNC
ncbi:MAG: trypsin-like serine peptidase [Geminicoccaceae bacterium]